MTNFDFERLMQEAAATEDSVGRPDLLAQRLRRADRARRTTVFAATTMAVVAFLVGAAAAWPETEAPFELRVGVEGNDPAAPEDDGDPAPVPDLDSASELDDAVETPQEERPDLSDEPASADDDSEPAEQAAPALELDFELSFDFASGADDALEPVVVSPTPAPTPTHVAPPPADDGHDSAEPAPKKTKKKKRKAGEGQAVAFTATAAYGSCGEDIPYDNYSGTATPGATVTITSPWSSPTTTTADGQGHWAVQVTFEAAPVGEPFTVTAASGGSSASLGFVRTA